MEPAEKKLRRLIYGLTELEAALLAAGRSASAASLARAANRRDAAAGVEFLHDCREALEAMLLGERNLDAELIGQALDALAMVDENLRQR